MFEGRFKVWDKINKKFDLSPFVIDRHGILWLDIAMFSTTSKGLHPVLQSQYIVLWYTGKRDKNKKEIYEGDKIADNPDKVFTICWDENYARFYRKPNFAGGIKCSLTQESAERSEVVGNIYEETKCL